MAFWQSARPPAGFVELWCQEFGAPSELFRLRARLRATLTGRTTVARPEREHWAERLVLVADELASNGLRHGGPPVAAALSRGQREWLIAVSDSSTGTPPTPARDRDPGLGGFGLHLVADLAARHGWFVHRGAKTVWAVVRTSPEGT